VERFTGRAELAGAAASLRLTTSLVTQFVVGLSIPRIRNLPRYIAVMMFAGYSLPFLMVPVLMAGASPVLAVASLLGVIALLWVADGAIVIGWYDLVGRTLSGKGRASLLSNLQLFGSIGSFASAVLVKVILDATAMDPRIQYTLIFLCAGVFLVGGASMMLFTRDRVRQPAPAGGLLLSLRRLPAIWKGSARYRSVVAVQVLFALATMCIPHLILFCKDAFQLPPHRVTWLIGIQFAGALAGGLAGMIVAPRRGNAALVILFSAVALAVPAAAIVALLWLRDAPVTWLLVQAIMFLSGTAGAAWIGFANRTIDILPPGDLPPGMAAVSLVSVPLSLAPYGAGLLAGRAGFGVMLGLCAALAAAALVTALRVPPGGEQPAAPGS
jgi:hypothetical protein